MIGTVITGHGNFASGLSSSLNLIVGEGLMQNYKYIDFESEDSVDDLENNLKLAMKELEACDEILFLTDLVGGSPFKSCVMLSSIVKNARVITGTNLPLLIECELTKGTSENLDDFVKQLEMAGKDNLFAYEYTEYEEEVSEDGI